jgi:hypothetical protein
VSFLKYFVRYQTQTPASLIDREQEQKNPKVFYQIDYPDYNLAVYNSFGINEDGDHLHAGLGFDFIIEAESWDDALDHTGDVADDLSSLIAYTTNTEVSQVERKQAFEWDEDSERKFTQNLMTQPLPVASNLTVIDQEFLEEVFNLIYNEDRSESDKRKIMRGLYQFRRSLEAEREEDEFLRLYIALDSIEYLLRDIYGERTKEYDCENCDGIAATDTDLQSGRKGLFEDSEFLDEDFSEIAKARNLLFHAGKSEKAYEHIEDLRRAFRIAVAKIMDVDIEKYRDQILAGRTTNLRREEYIFEGVLRNFEPTKLQEIHEKPAIKPDLEVKYEIDENFRLNSVLDYQLEKYTPNEEEIIGDGISYYYYGKIGDMVLKEHNQGKEE